MISPPAEVEEPLPRGRVGPYVLRRILGSGGMGLVYEGMAPDGRRVAIKTLRAHLRRPQDVQRFEREASIRIAHPNVIEVLGSGVDPDGTPYIVFELLDGESLDERLERGPLSPEEAVPIVLRMCHALAAAHAVGVIHRDLKPANVFCCRDGRDKLLDFGIARVGDTKVTAEGTVVGTLSYLSPEQARGTGSVDARTDVWALGALLFEMVSGTAPFDRSSAVATLLAILNEEPPELDAVSGASVELARVVGRCLRKPPSERWSDAAALAAALEAVDLKGATVSDIRPVHRSGDSFAETIAASDVRPSIRPDEQRIVAVLLARDVVDLSSVEAAITARGGRFFALLGKDAIGLFGAERLEGDETHRAVRAGLDCRMAARSVAVGSGRIRSSGIGLAGEALRQAEIAGEAEAVGVAISSVGARDLAETFNVRELGEELSEVVGERPGGASIVRADGELIGREVELAQLRAMASIALDGRRATLVLVVGPPGIGKSRLRRELATQLATERSPHLLLGQTDSGQRSLAFATWAATLRRRADVAARDEAWPRIDRAAPPSERAMAVRMLAREALPPKEADRCADSLGELLGVEVQRSVEVEAARNDPRLMSDRVRLALLDYLTGVVGRGPTLVLLEDLEWADRASLDLLGELLERSKDRPLFVLGTVRDDVSLPTEIERRAILRLRLDGLGPAQVASLADRVARRELSDDTHRMVAMRTEGNPLFVEQLVLALEDSARHDPAGFDQPLPLSVEAAVQSRLDRLEEGDRTACKLLSLFDRPARASELEALGVLDASTRMRGLVDRDLLDAASVGGATTYEFRSALMAEVAYLTIVPELRRELHARLGRTLTEQPGADPEEAARHLERGGLRAAAAHQYVEAVGAAARRGDSESVIRCSAAALELGVEGDEDRYDLHMARADALRFRGDREAQSVELERALQHSGTDVRHARVLIELAILATRRGQLGEAKDHALAALERAERARDVELNALTLGRLGEIRMHAGELDAAEADLDAAAQLAEARTPRIRAMIAEWRALLASARGDIGTSWAHFADAVDRAAEAGDERRAAGNLANLADAYNRTGSHEEAIEALERALEGCRRVGNRQFEGYVLLNLAYARMARGEPTAALGSIEEAAALAAATHSERMAWGAELYRARCLLSLGREREAERVARTLVDAVTTGREATSWSTLAACLLGRIALARGNMEEALTHTEAAVRWRDELGGLEEDEAEIYLARAVVLTAAGRAAEAEAIRRRGRERLHEVAARIADPAWRDRFLWGPAAHRSLLDGSGPPTEVRP